MTNLIIDTADVAEIEGRISNEEPSSPESDLVATKEASGDKLEFHVSMRGYTLSDMEELIVHAAAMQLIGRIGNPTMLAKKIEERAVTLISDLINQKMAGITAEIMNQPLLAKGGKDPITMADFIGITTRDYLMTSVGSDGKPITDSWGRRDAQPRAQHIVSTIMDKKLENEIKQATSAAINEIRTRVEAAYKDTIDREKRRFNEALDIVSAVK